MVDTSNKLKETIKLIDKGKYFIINKLRQYGKTITLKRITSISRGYLEKYGLNQGYLLIFDFRKLNREAEELAEIVLTLGKKKKMIVEAYC